MKKLKSFSLLLKTLCIFSLFIPLKAHAAPALFWILFGGIGGGLCCAITSMGVQTCKEEEKAMKPRPLNHMTDEEAPLVNKTQPTIKSPRASVQDDEDLR